jgi:diguanylate cyclase (GGDEF)-like protein
MVLLSSFLLVSFVNLSVFEESGPLEVPLLFSTLSESDVTDDLPGVLEQIKNEPERSLLRTHLNETPYWVYSPVSQTMANEYEQILFRSRHIVQHSCWLASESGDLQQIKLEDNHGRVVSANLGNSNSLQGVLCKFKFIGPASLEIGLQTTADLNKYILMSERRQSFLEGVLYLMIGMVAVAAFMTRSALFVSYGFWLFASLRLVALSEGWDHTIFGFELKSEPLMRARMLALAMYFSSTVLIVTQLFENIRRESWLGVLRALQCACFILLALAIFSPYRAFLELLWPMSLVAAFAVAWVVVQNFLEKRDRVAIYYLAAMLISLAGAVAEVLSAWFDQRFLVQYVNSASVTVLASVMTGVALAEFLRKAQRQQQLAAQEIREAHERLENVFDIAPSAMFTCTRQGQLIHFNKQFTDLFLNQDGVPTLDFLQPQRLAALFNFLEQPGKSVRRELPVVVSEGQTRWYELVVSRDHRELVGVVADFTARKDRELALHFQATHDELTGALNRRGLQNIIHKRLNGQAANFTFFCVDIRHFSRLISAYGLAIADQLLQAFYTELYRHMNAHGEISRMHFDQFAVMIQQNDSGRAEEAFNAFLHRLDSVPFQFEGRSIQVSALATLVFQSAVDNVLDVMETVEMSMRESKLKAKRVSNIERVVFEQNQTRRLLDQSRTIRRLDDQKLPAGLTLAWQPILAMNDHNGPLYVEALLRIKDETGKLGSAGFLLEACERAGRTAFLDSWVLSRSLDFLNQNATQLKKLSVLSINVSPGSLNDETFLQDSLALIKAHQQHASKLCLEITEVGSVINLQAVQAFIEKVRGLGVRIALDDFGAGYSNFRYAMDLHADVIKIDGSIVKNICQSTESHAVVTAIVGLAHDLGCKCVAEWVEDLHTLRELKELGVDYAQGYLVSPAVECEHFLNLNSTLELMPDQGRARMIQDALASVSG